MTLKNQHEADLAIVEEALSHYMEIPLSGACLPLIVRCNLLVDAADSVRRFPGRSHGSAARRFRESSRTIPLGAEQFCAGIEFRKRYSKQELLDLMRSAGVDDGDTGKGRSTSGETIVGTNVHVGRECLVRFLVNDDPHQPAVARTPLADLTADRPGFVCREVAVELSWVLERAYGFSRDCIATVLDELAGTEKLQLEAADDVIRSAEGYRRGGAGFSDRMIVAAARRAGADVSITFDRRAARLPGAVLLANTPA